MRPRTRHICQGLCFHGVFYLLSSLNIFRFVLLTRQAASPSLPTNHRIQFSSLILSFLSYKPCHQWNEHGQHYPYTKDSTCPQPPPSASRANRQLCSHTIWERGYGKCQFRSPDRYVISCCTAGRSRGTAYRLNTCWQLTNVDSPWNATLLQVKDCWYYFTFLLHGYVTPIIWV